jgi:hypothetical protein
MNNEEDTPAYTPFTKGGIVFTDELLISSREKRRGQGQREG